MKRTQSSAGPPSSGAVGIPVAVACRVLGYSKQAFYAWNAEPATERVWSNAHLINAALDVHRDDPALVYRFIADELEDQGFNAGENRRGCAAASRSSPCSLTSAV